MDVLQQLLPIVLLGLYLYCFLARFLLSYHQADSEHSLSRLLIRVTDPLYRPVRRVVPSVRGLDVGLLVIALALELLVIYAFTPIPSRGSFLGVLLFAITEVGAHVLWLYLYCLIVDVLACWLEGPSQQGRAASAPNCYLILVVAPYIGLVRSITQPVRCRIQRMLPPSGWLDFSLVVALLGINVLQIGIRQLGVWSLNL